MLADLQDIGKSFGGDIILKGLCARIEDRRRIGLIGPNGAGKTTLFNIIAGELQPDEGRVDRQAGLVTGYLRQQVDASADSGRTIMEELREPFAHAFSLEAQALHLSREMAAAEGEAQQELGERYAQVQAAFEAAGGHGLEVRIQTVLTGMGFGVNHGGDKAIAKLSGGERIRLAMAKLLLLEPGLLLLDEPTNHLDFKTLAWLESYLQGYKGTVIAVSHDRYFLDRVCQEIWELEGTRLYSYPGNYSGYRAQKRERVERQMKLYLRQQGEIAKLEDYVARNIARASTAASARSRQNQLDKMERIARPRDATRPIQITFTPRRRPGKDVLTVDGLALAVGQGETRRVLADELAFHLERGEKVALIGRNGTGKTTFLHTLTGRYPAQTGKIDWGVHVDCSYFEQMGGELDASGTVLDAMRSRFPRCTDQELRTALGGVGLSGEDVFRGVGALSGGEKARLRFAIMAKEQPNVMLLDEPTNHLDLAAREALEEALMAYEGTLLIISHDRYLLDKLPGRIVELSESGLCSYNGGFGDYMEKSGAPAKRQSEGAAPSQGKSQYQNAKQRRSGEARRRKALAQTQEAIAALETEIAGLEQEIADPQNAADFETLGALCTLLEEKRQAHSEQMEQWIALEAESPE